MPASGELAISAGPGWSGYWATRSAIPCLRACTTRPSGQGIDMVYLAFDVPPEHCPRPSTGLRALGFRGANVTIPHKEAIASSSTASSRWPLASAPSTRSSTTTAVLVGYNTDKSGFAAALRRAPRGGRGPALPRGRGRRRGARRGGGPDRRGAPPRSRSATARRQGGRLCCALRRHVGSARCLRAVDGRPVSRGRRQS